MKSSALSTRDKENIVNELISHYQMNQENIIRLYDHSEQDNSIYLLLEHAEGGTLFSYLNKHVKLDVHQIAKFFVQTCRAVEHVHSRGFIHRDLKPENILLDKNLNIKLCDFGWCASIHDHTYRKVISGTYEYMSPETLHGQLQGYEADIWSLGVLLFELHHNIEPFKGRSVKEVLHSIKNVPLRFDVSVSPEAKDLILRILTFDARARPRFEDIYNHPFVQKYGKENFRQESGKDQLRRAQSFTISATREAEVATRDNKDQFRKNIVREHSVQQPQVQRIDIPEQPTLINFSSQPFSPKGNTEQAYFRQRSFHNRSNYRPLISPRIDPRSRPNTSQSSVGNLAIDENNRQSDFAGYIATTFSRSSMQEQGLQIVRVPTPTANSFIHKIESSQHSGSPRSLWKRDQQKRIEAPQLENEQAKNCERSRVYQNCFVTVAENVKPSTTPNRIISTIRPQGNMEIARHQSNKENTSGFSSMANQRAASPSNHLNMHDKKPWQVDGSFASISQKLKEGFSTPMSINRSAYLERARNMAENKSFVQERENSKHQERVRLDRTLSEVNQNVVFQNKVYPQKASITRTSAQDQSPYLTTGFSKPVLVRQRTNIESTYQPFITKDHMSVLPYRRTFTLQ